LLVTGTVAMRQQRSGAGGAPPSPHPGQPGAAVWSVTSPDADTGEPGRLTVVFPEPVFENVDDGTVIRMDGQAGRGNPGTPDLPVFAKSLPGVPGHSITGTIVRAIYAATTAGIEVAAVEMRETVAVNHTQAVTRVQRKRDDAIYGAGAYWPHRHVEVTEAWMGTRKLARVVVAPVQYNPIERTVRVCRELDVELHLTSSVRPEGERGPL